MKNIIKKKISQYLIKLINYHNRIRIKQLVKSGVLNIGEHTYYANDLMIDVYSGSEAKVHIGKYCSIGPSVRLITGGIHPVNWASTFPFKAKWNLDGKFTDGMPYTKGDIELGNDVWVGTNVTILSGVKVGHGAVLATNTTVTKDVPDYAIVAGNPAKIVKYRFTEEERTFLLKLKWWDWSEEKNKK